MRWRGPATTWSGRTVGITLLILGLVHAPLPEPDFHNIRHHDGAGEVCEHHDHLLRWHPGAGAAQDVSVLHWHWFWPGEGDAEADGSNGTALHAHSPGGMTGVWDVDGPVVAPDDASRPLDRSVLGALDLPLSTALAALSDRGPLAVPASRAPVARRISLTSLLHRWVC